MTSPVKLTDKIDDFAVEVSIADIALLTKGLIQLQHARYPHLVPMYRTVHRTKPRKLVLRAIRWVNPKRMFPGAGLTRAEMQNKSSEELSDLIVKLNDYRGEAHVIHNRYNQMLDLINMGELPYFIPYAGFKQDKWSMLQEYKDRAERLKDGTQEWEDVLDRQALEIRNILLKREEGADDGKERVRLDDIAGLWEDAQGNPAAPNFLDLKKGKGAKQALRRQRISSNGERVAVEPKVFARRFIAVPRAEQRPGEQIRMPAGGQLRRPGRNNPRDRRIFDEHGGAADFLVRMPRVPWMDEDMERQLRERGQMITMLPNQKNPMMITWAEISNSDVANRRVGRWTHTDPLRRRGRAQHIGGASHGASAGQKGPEPHQEGAPVRRDAREVQAAERRVRQRQQRGEREGRQPAGVSAAEQEAARQINQEFTDAAVNLFEKHNVSAEVKAKHERLKAINDNDIDQVRLLSGGINAADGVVMALKLNDGSEVVYKMVKNEQKAELVSEVIDKIFNLNVNSDTVINRNISAATLAEKLGINPNGSRARALSDAIASGGGHLQEFCKPDCVNMRGHPNSRALYANEGFRNDLHKMMMNDWLTGNWDRHSGNWMVTSNGKAVQIDSGFGSDFAHYGDPFRAASNRGQLMAKTSGGAVSRTQHSGKKPGDLSREDLKAEIEAVFEDHFSVEKFQSLKQEFGMGQANNLSTFAEFKQDYLDKSGQVWGLSLGQASPPEKEEEEEAQPPSADVSLPSENVVDWAESNPNLRPESGSIEPLEEARESSESSAGRSPGNWDRDIQGFADREAAREERARLGLGSSSAPSPSQQIIDAGDDSHWDDIDSNDPRIR